MSKRPAHDGFVPLTSLRTPDRTPRELLAEIRRIYFDTGAETIQEDLDHAISLLKALPTEEDRDKAAVYMEGLTEMRTEWAKAKKRRRARKSR